MKKFFEKIFEKILAPVIAVSMIAAVVASVFLIQALLGGAVMKLFGFHYESMKSVILFFVISGIIAVPFDFFCGVFPKVLRELGWFGKTGAFVFQIVLAAAVNSVIMVIVDSFMDSVLISGKGIFAAAFLMAFVDAWLDRREEKQKEKQVKIGVISDIHNNLAALNAVLERFKREECTHLICCGDILGLGAYPEETVKRLRELPDLSGCVRGNHDGYLIDGMAEDVPAYDWMEQSEYDSHKWEHARLSEESKEFLKRLPYERYLNVKGKILYLVHYPMNAERVFRPFMKEPDEGELRELFAGIEADIIVYGHTHVPYVLQTEDKKRWYINSGSLGCPGQDKNIARAGILTISDGVEYRQIEVSYDVSETLEKMDELNYPDKENVKKYFYGIKEKE